MPHQQDGPHGRIVIGDVAAISRISKLEAYVLGSGASDNELSEMDRPVMQIADGHEVPQLVAAASTLVFDMVEI